MGFTLYKVLVNGVTVAERMIIEHAVILVKALFSECEYFDDSDMAITIRKMETTENDKGE